MVQKGLNLTRPILKPIHDSKQAVVEIRKRTLDVVKSKSADEDDPLVLFEKLPENKIVVPERLHSPHPLVKITKAFLKSRDVDKYGRIMNHGLSCFNVHVSKALLPRTMIIMNTIIKELEKREMKIFIRERRHPNTVLSIKGEELEIGIEEPSGKVEHQKTKSELEDAKRYPSLYAHTTYDYKPLGKLRLFIATYTRGAIENIRKQDVKSVDDLKTLEKNIHGMELKPLPFMLCITNLILHDISVPNVDYTDSLNREYTSIGQKDKVEVILANPPFGASVADRVETNFPVNFRTTESADLFLMLMVRYLNDGGRAGIVLPDGSLTGDGVKQRIRQYFLENCNLHTIVRLPNSVFQPYASVATNLLFFEKVKPTKFIWYWEHKLPEGVKAYSKTKPIQKREFDTLKKWWKKRKENEQAWKVSIDTIVENGYNLDIKNPHTPEVIHEFTSAELMNILHDSFRKSDELLEKLKKELANG
jgi:hypothetical protein